METFYSTFTKLGYEIWYFTEILRRQNQTESADKLFGIFKFSPKA